MFDGHNLRFLLTASFCRELAADGKSFVNPAAKSHSEAYSKFVSPIANDSRGGFDIHIYYLQTNDFETKFANELHERIRRECNDRTAIT